MRGMNEHHYAVDAAEVLEMCRERLERLIRSSGGSSRLVQLDAALLSTERILHAHLLALLDQQEGQTPCQERGEEVNMSITADSIDSLSGAAEMVKELGKNETLRSSQRRRYSGEGNGGNDVYEPRVWDAVHPLHFGSAVEWVGPSDQRRSSPPTLPPAAQPQPYSSSRGAKDSLLFRLIVTLQLCLVRIEEAERVLHDGTTDSVLRPITVLAMASFLARGTLKLSHQNASTLRTTSRYLSVGVVSFLARRGWAFLWMKARLTHSTKALQHWQQLWLLIHSIGVPCGDNLLAEDGASEALSEEVRSQRLLEMIPLKHSTSSLWDSFGSFRFYLIKRAMDILYASVGTALQLSGPNDRGLNSARTNPAPVVTNSLWMAVTAAAAASYYSLIGAATKSATVVSSSTSSDVLQNAWGVVSLPAVKRFSLEASKLLKGAAVAERVVLGGVPCFVLSKSPFPALSASLRRSRRQQRREVSSLSTIPESGASAALNGSHTTTATCGGLPTKDIILHLTGGGFFAHTIAGDLPYLLDWSAATGAVVMCPEYALLPEHPFPVAMNQVSEVYAFLMRGEGKSVLGFQPHRVIVTGESAGGNLGAALCVRLISEYIANDRRAQLSSRKIGIGEGEIPAPAVCSGNDQELASVRLPDAIMLCCPALNLSLEPSPSRVVGRQDPVLPSGLLTAISNAYIPQKKKDNDDKTNPLASPYFAPNEVLRQFPPTLLLESSEDPLLDDSVNFNARLRQLGVESDLRAVHNMPHAFWGLSTAGFPEAVLVQRECQDWLREHFQRQSVCVQ